MHEIEVSITLKGLDVATLIRLLSSAQLGGETISVRPIKAAPAKEIEAEAKPAVEAKEKRKPGRPSKKKPEPEEDESEEEGEESEEESDEAEDDGDETDEADDSDESDDEAEKPSKDKKSSSKKITIDDLTAAFADYTKDNGRDAAAKVLKKFDVKVIRKAPEEIWPKLIKALKA